MLKLYTSSFYASIQQILPLVLAPNRIHSPNLIPPNARFCHNVHLMSVTLAYLLNQNTSCTKTQAFQLKLHDIAAGSLIVHHTFLYHLHLIIVISNIKVVNPCRQVHFFISLYRTHTSCLSFCFILLEFSTVFYLNKTEHMQGTGSKLGFMASKGGP